jgi:MHS family proline/betaine transporter-like MFS transporter
MATLLIAATANDLAPAWYLVAAALVSLVAVALSRETCREPLRHD